MNEEINIKNIRKKVLDAAKDCYVKRGYKDYIPNSNVSILSPMELFFIGLNDNKSSHKLNSLLKRLNLPTTSNPKLLTMIKEEYPGVITNKEKKEHELLNYKQKASQILSSLDTDYKHFVLQEYKSNKNIALNEKTITIMQKAFLKPKEPVLLSTFALDVLNDTHGFDKGVYRNFLDKIIDYLYGNIDINNHNLYVNFSTNLVYTNNILKENFRWSALNIKQLNFTNDYDFIENKDIYIFENIGVYEWYGLHNPTAHIISTAGFINLASKKLIEILIKNGNSIYYSGDLDTTGIKIADGLLYEFPQIKIYKMDIETYERYYIKSIKQDNLYGTNFVIKNEELLILYNRIIKDFRYIYQESIEY